MSRPSMADEIEIETHTEVPVEVVPSIGEVRSALTRPPSGFVTAADFTHTPCYCEENVYLLCKKLISIGVAESSGLDLFVVFISNEFKKIPLWYQKASKIEEGLVVWDYHVICTQVKSKESKEGGVVGVVWDLDSTLPFPLALGQYIRKAIRPLSFENSAYRRLFRIVHAPIFLEYFASDRSHMKGASGNWTSPPPTYDPIVAQDGTKHNLNEYMKICSPDKSSMKELVERVYANKFGVVVSEALLEEFFSQIHV